MDPDVNDPDWKPKVLTKHVPVKPKPSVSKGAVALANDFDPASHTPIVTATRTLGTEIQLARTAKGWKQADLDKNCALPKGTTASYESSKAVYNATHVNKMARALDVILTRPKKPKST